MFFCCSSEYKNENPDESDSKNDFDFQINVVTECSSAAEVKNNDINLEDEKQANRFKNSKKKLKKGKKKSETEQGIDKRPKKISMIDGEVLIS